MRDINKPIGVAEYTTKLLEALPKKLQSSLPTIEEIEAELMPTLEKKAKKAPAAKTKKTKEKK